jgi:Aspartyl protease/PDZ domain
MRKSTTCFILFVICIVLYLPTQAQEDFVSPPAKSITKFSFLQLSGGVILVEGQLDNFKDTLHFVLDTGSGGISLDSTTVEKLQLPKTKTERIIRGIAGMKKVDYVLKHVLRLPNLVIDSLDFHVNDYDLLTSVYGVKIDGIIGFSFLRRYIVKVDYDKSSVEILLPGTIKYPKGGYLLKPQFGSIPILPLNINDDREVAAKFFFDTGAGMNMLLSRDFIGDSAVLKKRRKLFTTQAEGLGGKKIMDMTVIEIVKIGPYKFKKVPVYVFDDEFNVTNYPQLGGLIGNDILRRFNVIINYPEQSIHIKPNTHFSEAFDYSYSGLSIYMTNGEVMVGDVMKGSPAEKAGFLAGDIIFAVDNNFSHNIQIYKIMLQNIREDVKILVTRNGSPIILTMDVKSIL